MPDEIEYQTKNISAAGNRFQNNMISVMRKQDVDVYNLAYLAIPMDENRLKRLREKHSEVYGFVTKQAYGSSPFSILKSVRAYHRCLKERIKEADVVMCYNVNYTWLNLPRMAKRFKKKSILILADYSGPECFRSIKGKLYAHVMKRAIRRFDVVVGLSSEVETILKVAQTFILMEGGIDETFYHEFDDLGETALSGDNPKKEYRIMYSGLLSKVTGVDQLIDIMDHVAEHRNNVRLVISGKGDLEELIKEKQKSRPWMNYLGYVPYQQYIEELKKADLFVNPRNMDLPENTNNFPSKVLDYLATGKPILSTRFAGWERFTGVISFSEIDKWEYYIVQRVRQVEENNNVADEENWVNKRNFASQFLWEKQIQIILGEKPYLFQTR